MGIKNKKSSSSSPSPSTSRDALLTYVLTTIFDRGAISVFELWRYMGSLNRYFRRITESNDLLAGRCVLFDGHEDSLVLKHLQHASRLQSRFELISRIEVKSILPSETLLSLICGSSKSLVSLDVRATDEYVDRGAAMNWRFNTNRKHFVFSELNDLRVGHGYVALLVYADVFRFPVLQKLSVESSGRFLFDESVGLSVDFLSLASCFSTLTATSSTRSTLSVAPALRELSFFASDDDDGPSLDCAPSNFVPLSLLMVNTPLELIRALTALRGVRLDDARKLIDIWPAADSSCNQRHISFFVPEETHPAIVLQFLHYLGSHSIDVSGQINFHKLLTFVLNKVEICVGEEDDHATPGDSNINNNTCTRHVTAASSHRRLSLTSTLRSLPILQNKYLRLCSQGFDFPPFWIAPPFNFMNLQDIANELACTNMRFLSFSAPLQYMRSAYHLYTKTRAAMDDPKYKLHIPDYQLKNCVIPEPLPADIQNRAQEIFPNVTDILLRPQREGLLYYTNGLSAMLSQMDQVESVRVITSPEIRNLFLVPAAIGYMKKELRDGLSFVDVHVEYDSTVDVSHLQRQWVLYEHFYDDRGEHVNAHIDNAGATFRIESIRLTISTEPSISAGTRLDEINWNNMMTVIQDAMDILPYLERVTIEFCSFSGDDAEVTFGLISDEVADDGAFRNMMVSCESKTTIVFSILSPASSNYDSISSDHYRDHSSSDSEEGSLSDDSFLI